MSIRASSAEYIHHISTFLVTSDGKLHEIDILALATGFDAVTGGLLKIDLTDVNGKKLNEKWSNGIKTYQGISIAGYPNMFFTYGPQAPTAFANGPTLGEIQADWIAKVIDRCEENDVKLIVADEKAQEKWVNEIHEMSDKSLFPLADSWYMGANIPGKKREMSSYVGGIPKYAETLKKSFNNNLEGYILVKN
jgi:cation diffusion facilitator CzcD-associated flavoprotein CzcO